MSNTTPGRAAFETDDAALERAEPRGPGRFGEHARGAHDTSPGSRAGSAMALLLLVVGVPVALWLVAGASPFPTSLPDKDTLTAQLTFDTLLRVLLFVVWVAWLLFVVCVAVEVVAARRGGLGRPVPLGGPVQRLARVLVGAALLAEVVSGPAASAVAPDRPVETSVSAAQAAGTVLDDVAEQVAARTAVHEITEQSHLVGHKVYTVAAPKDGYHDNLWDIAERTLGDGRRYQEIYQLNKGLQQPDGRKLELARLIQPGWNLVMPEDATGVSRLQAPPADAAPAPTPGGAESDTSVAPEQGVEESPLGLLGTGLLAAATLAALAFERRRRIGARADGEVEVELRGWATPSRAAFLDRALRDLAAACREAGAALPPVYAVTLDDEQVTLRLAPATPEPVGEWRTADAGATWTRDFFDADEASVEQRGTSEVPSVEQRATSVVETTRDDVAPYPALVSLGVDPQGRDVLVDLEAAGGLVAVDGDPTIVSEVAAAIALQAGTASWSSDVRVLATGLPDGLTQVGDARVRVVDALTGEIDALEEGLAASRADVLTGRLTGREAMLSHLVVAGGPLDATTADRLVGLTGPQRQSLSVVLAGAHPAARWTLRVDSAGHLRLDELDIAVTANRIGHDQVEAVARLFEAARQPDGPDQGGQVAIPRPLRLVDDAAWTTAARRVGVLGSVAVTGVPARGEEPEDIRSAQLMETVVYLALHPEGVHPNVLAGVLWPRGVTPDVSSAVVERAREWLGDDVHGHAYLREDAEGRLALSPGVVCDWDAVRSLFLRAREASTRRDEIELLRRGLQLVRGESFAGVPDGRYAWIAHDDLLRTIRLVVVSGAHRLVKLLSGDDDPGGAGAAAEAGLRLDPANQLLWRDLLRARHAADGPAGVRRTMDAMGAPLRGIALEAETEALVQEYLPEARSAG